MASMTAAPPATKRSRSGERSRTKRGRSGETSRAKSRKPAESDASKMRTLEAAETRYGGLSRTVDTAVVLKTHPPAERGHRKRVRWIADLRAWRHQSRPARHSRI